MAEDGLAQGAEIRPRASKATRSHDGDESGVEHEPDQRADDAAGYEPRRDERGRREGRDDACGERDAPEPPLRRAELHE